MKSKYLLIIVIFILLIAGIAYADLIGLHKQKVLSANKAFAEKNLLEVSEGVSISSERNTSEPASIPAIIILKNQPLDKTVREAQQKQSGQIEDYRREITSILDSAKNKLSPRTEDARRKEAFEREMKRKSAVTAQQEVINILSSAEKQKIKELKRLRSRGYSITELTARLSVPKTTVWHHIQGIKILPKYISVLEFKKRNGSIKLKEVDWKKAQAHAYDLLRTPHREIAVAAAKESANPKP